MYRVLLVDDDPHILNTDQEFLRRKGCEVFCAETAEDAPRIAQTASLDAIVLDVDLPGLDGISARRSFAQADGRRNSRKQRKIPLTNAGNVLD